MATTGRSRATEAFLVSLGAILLEVSWTRILSFKLVYYFTYLVIGIAMLGLGSGGVLVAVLPSLRRAQAERIVPAACAIAAVSVLVGYPLVALLRVDAFDLVAALLRGEWSSALGGVAGLVALCALLAAPFLAAGIALAAIFSSDPGRIHRLYGADLLGAALGCAAVVPLIPLVSPPGIVMLAGLCFAAAALPLPANRHRAASSAALAAAALLALGVLAPGLLPEPRPDRVKTLGAGANAASRVIFSRWSPVFRVDVATSLRPDAHFLVHDGTVGSYLERFDPADETRRERLAHSDRSYPFKVLGGNPRVAIIGSAGGSEVRASLLLGASRVTAVELNPVTVGLHRGEFADFLGHLADDPRVEMVHAEGRSFLRGAGSPFDVVWYVAPDSYASTNAATAGAFVLSESYLYTTEAILDSLARLAPGGVVVMQFGEAAWEQRPRRTVRYLATAREALRRIGIADPSRHLLVATAPGFGPGAVATTILVKATPFGEDEARRFVETADGIEGARVVHVWTRPGDGGPVAQVVGLDDRALGPWLDAQEFAVGPVRDDAPFFWHFVRFRDALRGRISPLHLEDGAGEVLLLGFVALAAGFAALLLLSPLLAIGPVWRAIPHKVASGAYFAALGAGFMLLEVSLIQRLTLFLGYPTYSLTVTLFALLLSSGAGSLLAGRLVEHRNRSLLAVGGLLAGLVLFDIAFLSRILQALLGQPLPIRIAIAIALVTPLGLCLGTLLPMGLRSVAAATDHPAEIVAWSWAVNGFFSVVSSVGATILAMTWGFDATFVLALAVYGAGIAALLTTPEPRLDPSRRPSAPGSATPSRGRSPDSRGARGTTATHAIFISRVANRETSI